MFGQRARGSLLGVVDVGSSKIVCLALEARAGRRGAPDQLICLGLGHQRSEGVKSGMVIDPPALEQAIRAAVAAAPISGWRSTMTSA